MVYIMVSMSNIILKEMIKQDPLQTLCNTFERDSFYFWEQLTFVGHSKMPILCKTTSPSIQRCYSFGPLFLLKLWSTVVIMVVPLNLTWKKLNVMRNVLHAVTVFELANVEYRCKKLKCVCTQEHRKWEVSSVAT